MAIAERLAEELRRPIDVEGRSLVVNASIGIALADGPELSADDLLANADAAMYVAKSKGKARYAVFDPTMRQKARKRLERETELREAIEHDEFELYYQPIIELRTRRIIGFEALARWQHPQRGLLGPAEFIPLAEATGLIVPLGRLVTTAACAQLRLLQALPGWSHLKLNVNVSVRQAVEPGFAAVVREALDHTGISPISLVLEMTESLMLQEFSRHRRVAAAVARPRRRPRGR